MTGRIPFGLLTVLAALVSVPIQAQGQMGPPTGNGVQPAGFHTFHEAAIPGQYHGRPQSYQRSGVERYPGPPAPTIYEELPDDLGFLYDESPLGNFLTDTFRHAWFRGEYLLWNISAPGDVLLGAQPSSGVVAVNNSNPLSNYGFPGRQQLAENVQFARTVNGVSGAAIAPGLDSFSNNNLNGFRGTFGLPVSTGTVELGGFVLQDSGNTYNGGNTLASVYESGVNRGIGTGYIQEQIDANPAVVIGGNVGADGNPATNGQQAQFISQPVLVNGVPQNMTATSSAIDYDVSYQAKLLTSAWGAEGNYVLDSPDPNAIIQLRPMIGGRYFNIRDRLNQFGQYNEQDAIDPTINNVISRTIDSAGNNNIFGPQLGLRAEAMHSRFLIGVEPKFTFGMNTWKTNLDTTNVFGSDDPAQSLTMKGTTFSPLFDVKFYSNVALSKNLSAFVAYNYIWVGQVNKSYNDVVYNQPDFRLTRNYSGTTLQGLSFGLELRY